MRCSCMYCVCRLHRLPFSTRITVQSLIIAKHRSTVTRILSPTSMWKTSAHLNHLPWLGFEPITFWSTISLTIRTPPLLVNLKVLNFRQWNQSGFSNPLKIISSYQHFQIPRVCATFMTCNATSQQMMRWKSMRKSWSHGFGQQQVMIPSTAWWSWHYLNTFWRTFTACWESDRQLIL